MAEIAKNNCIKLHIGAHRTGTTSLQAALHGQRDALSLNGIGYWGPHAMRRKRFPQVFQAFEKTPQSADELAVIDDIVATNTKLLADRINYQAQIGHEQMLVSEENILGNMKINLTTAALYPDLQERLAMFSRIFGPYCARVSLTIRPYHEYWRSLIAFLLENNAPLPTADKLESLCLQPLRWRNVIESICTAFPTAQIRVMEFEPWVGQHEAHIDAIVGAPLCLNKRFVEQKNASKDRADLLLAATDSGPETGRYQPFSHRQINKMSADYAEDMAWLQHGGVSRLKQLRLGETD